MNQEIVGLMSLGVSDGVEEKPAREVGQGNRKDSEL